MGLAHRPSWYHRRQAGAAVVLTGHAIYDPSFVLAWSRWRHQARARRAHYQRREQQVRLEY
jgi:hypothetical protein